MTVNEIMKLTDQKRGTVEQFRSELQKFKLISNNQSLDDRAVNVFKKSIEYKKNEQNTWIDSMQKAIQEEYGEEMDLPFRWTREITLKHLIWQIKKGIVSVESCDEDYENVDFHVVYEIMIDNFKELGKTLDVYRGSFGTDGNPITTYKCTGVDYLYYIVGKYNHITKNEDIHVFYNDGLQFNIMKCKHVCGGSCRKGRLEELWKTCLEYRKVEDKVEWIMDEF
ncbi:hypothetical protein [Wukongibacter baidiensis]